MEFLRIESLRKPTIDDLGYDPDILECKGVIFRGYNNIHLTGGRLEQKRGYRLLKRKSCPGCQRCSGMFELLQAELDTWDNVDDIEHNAMYEMTITTNVRYSGFEADDDYQFIFTKVSK